MASLIFKALPLERRMQKLNFTVGPRRNLELMHVLWKIITHSTIQFGFLFGVFILAGTILTLISRWTNNAFRQFLFPNFGIYAFGFIGVPVHEFAHALFCKIFLHQIRDVKWFDPSAAGGAHGAVTHEYNPWNIYHRIGHFFIGLGPVLIAPFVLGGLCYFLVPDAKHLLHNSPVQTAQLQPWLHGFVTTLTSMKALKSIGFWIFVYLGMCISSQMELSLEDLKQARSGLPAIALVLFVINTIAWLFSFSWHERFVHLGSQAWTMGLALYGITAFLAIANLLICTLLFTTINRVCGREGVNPFRG
jgi:hypothetical protein